MNLQTEKLSIIEWLIKLRDPSVLERIKWLKEKPADALDWWDEITSLEKKAILKGLEDIKRGKILPHEEVRKKYEKWL